MGGLQARIVRWRSVFGGRGVGCGLGMCVGMFTQLTPVVVEHLVLAFIHAFGCRRGIRSPHVRPVFGIAGPGLVPRQDVKPLLCTVRIFALALSASVGGCCRIVGRSLSKFWRLPTYMQAALLLK